MGTPLRDVVFDGGRRHAQRQEVQGGADRRAFRRLHPEPAMDLPMRLRGPRSRSAPSWAPAAWWCMDENTCMVDLAKFFMEFIQTESCGKCIPCREGTQADAARSSSHHPQPRAEEGRTPCRVRGVMVLKELGEAIKNAACAAWARPRRTRCCPPSSGSGTSTRPTSTSAAARPAPAGSWWARPARYGCPVGTEVWKYVAHIALGEYDEAYQAIRGANPFPSVCARVCNHPCESLLPLRHHRRRPDRHPQPQAVRRWTG